MVRECKSVRGVREERRHAASSEQHGGPRTPQIPSQCFTATDKIVLRCAKYHPLLLELDGPWESSVALAVHKWQISTRFRPNSSRLLFLSNLECPIPISSRNTMHLHDTMQLYSRSNWLWTHDSNPYFVKYMKNNPPTSLSQPKSRNQNHHAVSPTYLTRRKHILDGTAHWLIDAFLSDTSNIKR